MRQSVLKQKTFAAFCVVVMMVGLLYVFLLGSKSAETLNQLDPDIHPDVLVIMIDDLNDWVGILGGHPQAKTPNIDALANKSVTFLNAHAPAPLCSPSRSALLTGLRPSSSGIYNNHSDWRSLSLPFSITSLPKFFRENGYETYGAGICCFSSEIIGLEFSFIARLVHSLGSFVRSYNSWDPFE